MKLGSVMKLKLLMRILNVLLVLFIFIGVLYWQLSKVYPFHWNIPFEYANLYIFGLLLTMKISVSSVLVALIIGLIFGIMRTSHHATPRDLAGVYVNFVRNIPLIVVIFIIYYGVGTILNITRYWAAVLALSFFEGAYIAEIIRAGIESIERGQWEAAFSLGFTKSQILEYIIMPQAIRRIIPPLTGQFISLVKDSSLASVIALQELTMRGRQVANMTLSSFESYITIAVLYFTLTTILSSLGRFFEKRLAIP